MGSPETSFTPQPDLPASDDLPAGPEAGEAAEDAAAQALRKARKRALRRRKRGRSGTVRAQPRQALLRPRGELRRARLLGG